MKKTLKVLVIVALLLVMVLALTGCGNKIVATKTEEVDGKEVEQKIEITLKKDKVDKVKMTMKFDDKETAEKYKKQLDGIMTMASAFGGEEIDLDTKVKGKKLVINLDAKEFATLSEVDVSEEKVDKDELKKSLEEDGYKVK